MRVLGRLRTGLSRTTERLAERLERPADDGGRRAGVDQAVMTSSADTLEALEEILIEIDVGGSATTRLLDVVRVRRGSADLHAVLRGELLKLIDVGILSRPVASRPYVDMVVGVNGTGKTTTVDRLTRLKALAGENPLICAAETFRTAGAEQLEIWAKRAE